MKNLYTHDKDVFQNVLETTEIPTNPVITDSYISPWLYSLLMEYISYTMICMALFGLSGSILIIIIYTKKSFTESINISYCGLGISDFLCVVFATWNAICFIPAFSKRDVPFVPTEIVIPTGAASSEIFFHITAMITAYISLGRCLCVKFPFKVRKLVTRDRTMCVLIIIFLSNIVPLFSFYFITYQFVWDVSPQKNKSLLRVRQMKNASSRNGVHHQL